MLYTERSITNLLLGGKHSFRNSDWKIDWKLSPSLSRVYDKDHRVTPLRVTQEGSYVISPSASSFPIRIWRTLEEVNLVGKVDVDTNQDIAAKYGVRNIPTILFFKNGEVVDKSVGAVPKAQLAEKLDALV